MLMEMIDLNDVSDNPLQVPTAGYNIQLHYFHNLIFQHNQEKLYQQEDLF